MERVEPIYQPDGTAYSPVHRKALSEGRYGLFCPSKAVPDDHKQAVLWALGRAEKPAFLDAPAAA